MPFSPKLAQNPFNLFAKHHDDLEKRNLLILLNGDYAAIDIDALLTPLEEIIESLLKVPVDKLRERAQKQQISVAYLEKLEALREPRQSQYPERFLLS